MNDIEIHIPTNTSKYNEYDRWDRGLFLITDHHEYKAARVRSALWETKGDLITPGILQYNIEYFSVIPEEPDHLEMYLLRDSGTIHSCITRGDCYTPIVIEAYAIQHYRHKTNDSTEELVELINQQALYSTKQLTNNEIQDITISVHFHCLPKSPLELNHINVNYHAIFQDINDKTIEIKDIIHTKTYNPRPFHMVLDDIKLKKNLINK